MAKREFVKVRGLREMDKALAELSNRDRPAARRVARKSIRAGLKPVERTAKAKAPKRTGRLRKSIAIQMLKRGRHQVGVVGPRTKGKLAAPYAHLPEFGYVDASGRPVPAQPYMRPAWDAEGGQRALNRMAATMRPELMKEAKALGQRHRLRGRRR